MLYNNIVVTILNIIKILLLNSDKWQVLPLFALNITADKSNLHIEWQGQLRCKKFYKDGHQLSKKNIYTYVYAFFQKKTKKNQKKNHDSSLKTLVMRTSATGQTKWNFISMGKETYFNISYHCTLFSK